MEPGTESRSVVRKTEMISVSDGRELFEVTSGHNDLPLNPSSKTKSVYQRQHCRKGNRVPLSKPSIKIESQHDLTSSGMLSPPHMAQSSSQQVLRAESFKSVTEQKRADLKLLLPAKNTSVGGGEAEEYYAREHSKLLRVPTAANLKRGDTQSKSISAYYDDPNVEIEV